jgi:hypothetical protein
MGPVRRRRTARTTHRVALPGCPREGVPRTPTLDGAPDGAFTCAWDGHAPSRPKRLSHVADAGSRCPLSPNCRRALIHRGRLAIEFAAKRARATDPSGERFPLIGGASIGTESRRQARPAARECYRGKGIASPRRHASSPRRHCDGAPPGGRTSKSDRGTPATDHSRWAMGEVGPRRRRLSPSRGRDSLARRSMTVASRGASRMRRLLEAWVQEPEQARGPRRRRPLLRSADRRCCSTPASQLDARADLCFDRNVSRDVASIDAGETSGLPAQAVIPRAVLKAAIHIRPFAP